MKHNKNELYQMQQMPLEIKVGMTKNRIRRWINEFGTDGVYIAFSGGKDSTVLLDLVREDYPSIEAVFVDTGLEYPEIRDFVKSFDNVTVLRPKMSFFDVLRTYGYPLISKEVSNTIEAARRNIAEGKTDTLRVKKIMGEITRRKAGKSRYNHEKYKPLLDVDFAISDKCCNVMKKAPAAEFVKRTGKNPIIATMAEESLLRQTDWLRRGCNAFEGNHIESKPMSFWTEQDVLCYIKEKGLRIAPVYGEIVYEYVPLQMRLEEFFGGLRSLERLTTTGCKRTGCMFCPFGCQREKSPTRFERLKQTHPRQYEYCIGGGEYDGGIWKPNKKGLGLGHVFDTLNAIYGDGFIKY